MKRNCQYQRYLRIEVRFTIVLLAQYTISVAAETKAPAGTAERALNSWMSACADIWSYDVMITTTHFRVDSEEKGGFRQTSEYDCRHRYLNGMWRVDRVQERHQFRQTTNVEDDSVRAIAWDGKDARILNEGQKIGAIVPLMKLNRVLVQGPLYHESYLSSFYGEQYSHNIRQRTGIADIETNGTIQVVGPPTPAAVVSWNKFRIDASLDQNKKLMPTRLAVSATSDRSLEPLFEIQNSLMEWSPGLWVPQHFDKLIYQLTNAGHTLLVSKVTVELSPRESRFNLELDPKIFSLSFAPGTVVYDAESQRNFIATDEDGRDYEAYKTHIRDLIEEQELAKRKGSAVLLEPGNWSMGRIIGIAITLALIVMFSVLLLQKRRIRRN